MRQPKPELFECRACGAEVEIWSDEFSGKCPSCGGIVVRDGTMSCLEWCTMARECVGDAAFDSFNELRAASIKERLLKAARESAAGDEGSFHLIEQSLHYAEILAQAEKAELHVVLAGAVLAEAFPGQPERAREELLKMGFQLDDADEVCRIVEAAHGSGSGGVDSVNCAVVHDARLLAQNESGETGRVNYLTTTGLKLAG